MRSILKESPGVFSCYAGSCEDEDFFDWHGEKILQRLQFICGAYRPEMQLLGCDADIQRILKTDRAEGAFYLIHSSLEHTLENVKAMPLNSETLSHTRWLVQRVVDRAQKQAHQTIFFRFLKEPTFKQSFPSESCVKVETKERAQELWNAALAILEEYQPGLSRDIHRFVHDVVFDFKVKGELLGESTDFSPGHIFVAPLRLLSQEGRRYDTGSPEEVYLTAAQILHEYRHQKGFFYNRISDLRETLRPCGLVPRMQQGDRLIEPLQDYCLIDLFDLAMATSSEYFFLKYIMANKHLGDTADAFEAKMLRKKGYMLAACASGEHFYPLLGEPGQQTWESIQRFWGMQ